MKPRSWFVWLLTVALLITGCQGRQSPMQTQPVAPPQAEERPTSASALPVSNVILMDGELVVAYPSLRLAFSGNVSAKLLTLNVQVGQRLKKGGLIATLDDSDLKRAVEDAQLALDRAIEDKARAEEDLDEKYQHEKEDADEKHEREMENADEKYEREMEEAENALETAEYNLQRAKMQPPTTAATEAEVNLERARDVEAEAADNYKQALDRPWEPQSIRDSLYKEWQQRITDRELAQLRLRDALVSLEVYYLDLQAKERDVEKAKEKLAKVERDKVEKDEVEKETDLTTYERAIQDAQDRLAEAQENLQDAELYAPWDALVLSVDTSVGAVTSSGTPVVTLLNITDLYFVTENLSERHVAQLRRGHLANITLRTYPDIVLTGRVDTVIPQTERKSDAEARFSAYIRMEKSELDLLPGMTGRVEIITEGE